MQKIEHQDRLKWWPSPQDYNEAVQNLGINTVDAQLGQGTVTSDKLGLPRPMTGAFASVYRVETGDKDVALRCFLRDTSDQEQRYQMISEFISGDDLESTVGFEFIREGIKVNGSWFPALKMDWVEGQTLDEYIRDQLYQPDQLQILADNFVKLCGDLRRAGIAHGDFQHGNILVSDGELRLVDYDGMFVPKMQGLQSHELGHPNYQHPTRNESHFGPELDNFSAWVIYVSVQSLALDPSLFYVLRAGDDCLLFRRDDLEQPLYSHAFSVLEGHDNEKISAMARFLRWQIDRPLQDVPSLESGMCEVPPLSPLASSQQVTETDQVSPPVEVESPQQSAPVVEQELSGAVPRTVIRNPNCRRHNPMIAQIAMFMNPINLIMLIVLLGPISECQNLVQNGADYPGTILPNKRDESWVYYQYKVGTKDYRDSGRVSVALGSQLSKGDPVAVRALPNDPTVHRVWYVPPPGPLVEETKLALLGYSALFTLLASVCLALEALIWFGPLRHRELVRSGRAVVATIDWKKVEKGNKTDIHRIIYIFNTPEGPIKASDTVNLEQFTNAEPGQKVTVVYQATNPGNCTIYPYAHYKAKSEVNAKLVE